MNFKGKRSVFCSVLASSLLSSLVFADGPATQAGITNGSQQQLQDEVKHLRSEMDALKQQQATSNSTINATTRSSETTGWQLGSKPTTDPMQGFVSGFALDRFTVQSSDGNFVLRPWFHLQVRDITSVRQDYKVGGADDTENGFEIRRLRFGFDGNLVTPDLTYFFNWATVRASGTATVTNGGRTIGTVSNNLGGSPLLEEAWFKYAIASTPFFIHAGQIKDPVYHESIVSSRYQQATERSLTG